MNAQHVPRIGMARARGEHLQAANDPHPFPHPWEGEGRECPDCLAATRRALARVGEVALCVLVLAVLYLVLFA